MNNTPSTNNPDRPSEENLMTHEEVEELKKILSMSYPQPRHSVKDGVLWEIKKKESTKRTNRLLRYGGIAACFVLIMGVAIGIIPIINSMSKGDMAEQTSFRDVNECEADNISLTALDYSLFRKDASGKKSNAEADAENITSPSPAEYSAEPNTAAESPECLTSDTAFLTFSCEEHPEGMHIIPYELIDSIGDDAFNAWYNAASALDDCGMPSIRTFVRHFRIPEDKLTAIGNDSGITFPIALIYGENN